MAQFRANHFTFHRNTFSKISKIIFIAQSAQEGAKHISKHESFFQWKMTKTLRKNSDFFSINTNCTGKKYFSKNNFIAQTAQEGAKRISRHESFFQ